MIEAPGFTPGKREALTLLLALVREHDVVARFLGGLGLRHQPHDFVIGGSGFLVFALQISW